MGSHGMTSTGQELSWLLDDLAARVEDIQHAVILSRDGLAIAASQGFSGRIAHRAAVRWHGAENRAR